jgi:hypothetical protein
MDFATILVALAFLVGFVAWQWVDISITAANVLPVAKTGVFGGTEFLPTYNAGEAIAAGDIVYQITTTDGTPFTYKKAQSDVALTAPDCFPVGMAMESSALGQPVVVGRGEIVIGSGFTVGMQVNLSINAGKMAPVADIAATNAVVAVGCIVTATTVFIAVRNYAVLHA